MTESINPTPVPRMPPQAEDQSLAAGGAGGSEPCSEALLETFDMSVGSSPSEFPKGDVPTGDDLLGAFMRQAERARPKTKSDQVGDRFGNYKLLEQIGEGGFGVVWAADQEHPVRRRVALKIVKLGMDTKEVIARFEQERQALAMMDHPNIAKVFDAGATPTGRPYFVMELVRGIKITDYCDQAKLSTSERLELFITVCHAVQHAHQKGIIHRDLKPSNILVTLHDAVAVPKVIDFGVAKAMQHQRLTDLTIYTQFEQMIGTPLYMSPEQAQMSGLDVDTRSDIYSLGVLLYELLTGRTPFDPQKLMRQGLDDIRRSICDQEPPKPSAALHTMALATRNTIAQRRHVDPGKLLSLVRGDLDWIVMKALEKDRSRRYDTSAELAKDIQRHLAHEPVHARAPTQLYRFRRLVRRNRFTFAAIGAVAAALVVGLSVATYSFISERQARKSEAEQRILAEHHSQQARASAELAEASEFKATHLLYATDMHLAHEAIRSNNIGLARRLLDRHRPAQGEPDLRDWEWRYLYQECLSRAQATLTRREGKPVFAASYSPDGTLLLLGFSDGRVELWNVAARKLRRLIYPSAEAQVARAVFSPGGNTIAATATTGDQRMVRIVDINSGAERTLCTVPGVVRDLSYSRDGAWLAVLSRDPDRVVILGVDDGKPVMNYSLREGGGAFFNNVRISPDKERIYVSSGAFGEPIVQCVSIPDGRVFWEHPIGKIDDSVPEAGSDMGFSAMDLSPDGHALAVATGYRDSQLRILDAGSGNLITKRKGHSKYILQIAFSADGRFLASTSEDQTIGRWDTKNWTRIMPPLRGHNLEVNALAISRDGRYLATGSKDGEVLLWDTTVPPTTGGRRELPSDLTKVIPTAIGRVVLGESAGGWQQVDLLTLAEQPLPASELSADGSYPAFIPKTSRRPRPAMDEAASGLTGSVTAHAYSPDGRLLVLVSQSGEIGFYDAVSLARIEVLQSNLRTVFGVAFSPDGRRLVLSDGGDEGIAVWDVALRHELLVLPSNGSLLRDVGFTADGNAVVVRSRPKKDQACEFWQAPSFAEIDEAERAGGPWPQAELFPEPSPAPDLAELKRLLEAEYRRVLGLPRMNLPAQAARRQETIDALATLLEQQKKYGEAEPFFRQSLDITKQQAPRDDTVLLEKTRKLLSIVLASLAVERHLANPGDLAAQSTKADAIVDEILAILSRKAAAAASPDETFKLAVFQLWFDQKSELAGTHKRLIKWADQNAEDGSVAQYAAQALSLDPSGDPAFRERAVAFAENAIKLARNAWETAWAYKSLALANYRSRRFKESEQALNLAEQAGAQFEGEQRNLQPQFIGSTTFIRSMILFRTGREAEARELFSKGKMKMNPLPEDDRQLFEYENALHQALVWLAYKEAEALLHEEIPDVAKKAR